jgi:hypothetical protein
MYKVGRSLLPLAFRGARVSTDVTSGEGLPPDKPSWFHSSSKGLGVRGCFAQQYLAALVLDIGIPWHRQTSSLVL